MFVFTNKVGISHIFKISAGSEILLIFLHFHNSMLSRGYYFKLVNDFFSVLKTLIIEAVMFFTL